MELRSAKWLALGLFFALSATLGGVAVGRMDRFVLARDELREQPFILADALLRAHQHVHGLHSHLRDMVMTGDRGAVLALQQRTTDDDSGLAAALDMVVARNSGDERILAELIRTLSAWRETRDRVSELLQEDRAADASALQNGEGERRYRDLLAALNTALVAERQHAEILQTQAAEARQSAMWVMLGLAVLAGGALAATGLGLTILVRTSRPLSRLRTRLLALADGDTHSPIPYVNAPSAIGALARAVHCFRQSMIERDAANQALRLSEELLRQAVEESNQATAAKSRFLAAASHDLRQPMQALRLYLDTLDRRIEDRLDRRILTGALAALGAGEELLRNYLDISVLDSGIIQPTLTDMAIEPLLSDLMLECASLAADKGLQFHRVPCRAVIHSDAALLTRLLRNLLANAIRYTPSGGVLLGCRHHGDTLRIEVWDTGIGIPADQLDAVFEDFYQIGNSERDRAKGLGLGLSVVSRAARLLGHDVRVESRPGRGSVFSVAVPLVSATTGAKGALVAA